MIREDNRMATAGDIPNPLLLSSCWEHACMRDASVFYMDPLRVAAYRCTVPTHLFWYLLFCFSLLLTFCLIFVFILSSCFVGILLPVFSCLAEHGLATYV